MIPKSHLPLRRLLAVAATLVVGLGATWGWLQTVGGGPVAAAVGHRSNNVAGSWKYTNRLIDETSPYLLLHAHNPVEWYPWGEEALRRARLEDKPIFLSIGYSTCHWCHVMEHESFEDPEVAKLMNRWFVCIKIDREERPDIDFIYQSALQIMGQQGGWPLTMFLTSKGEPF